MVVIDCPPSKKQWSVIGITLVVIVATILVVVFAVGGSSANEASNEELDKDVLNTSFVIDAKLEDDGPDATPNDFINITKGSAELFNDTDIQDYPGQEIVGPTLNGVTNAGCLAAAAYFSGGTVATVSSIAVLACGVLANVVEETINYIINSFVGSSSNDDCWLTVTTVNINYADGDTMGVRWCRTNGDCDNDHLGYIGRGDTKTTREDTDDNWLTTVTVGNIHGNRDDVYVTFLVLTAGPENSRTDQKESIIITAQDLHYISGRTVALHEARQGEGHYVKFGDGCGRGTMSWITFNWETALRCRNDFFHRDSNDFKECLRAHSVESWRSCQGSEGFHTYHWD